MKNTQQQMTEQDTYDRLRKWSYHEIMLKQPWLTDDADPTNREELEHEAHLISWLKARGWTIKQIVDHPDFVHYERDSRETHKQYIERISGYEQ